MPAMPAPKPTDAPSELDLRATATSELLRMFVRCAEVRLYVGTVGGSAEDCADIEFKHDQAAERIAAEIDRRLPGPDREDHP